MILNAINLLEYVEKDSKGCWNWLGFVDKNGYGRGRFNGVKTRYSHRAAYHLYVGQLEGGLTIDHLCKNRRCINPRHLEQITLRENVYRGNPIWKQKKQWTHCKYGHAFTDDNTYVRPSDGRRRCRHCAVAEAKKQHLLSGSIAI